MKRNISLLLALLLTMSLSATSIKVIRTTYEQELLNSIGINDYSLVTNEDWYFSKDGIDMTSKKMVDLLPDSEPVILYGISLGGTVARRMTQIANDNGKNVKGYIAQSSPLSGDRLTNTGWAITSLALLGVYSLVGLNNLVWGLPLDGFLMRDIECQNYDLMEQLDDKSRNLINSVEKIVTNKTIDRAKDQSVIENATLPLLDLILGTDENGRGVTDYFGAVFSKNNNVKDLDPTGEFMVNIMNNSSSMEKEENKSIKRAFIVSSNGNLYETSAWNAVNPILTYYQNQRDSYWAKAKKQWWLFAYWSLRAAASSVSVATIEGLPRAWSTCVSGSVDYSTNDGFVPANDTFWGKKLQMTAPNMRDSKYDLVCYCDSVSHLDYGEIFSQLPQKEGRTYCRVKSIKQQQDALQKSYDFIK